MRLICLDICAIIRALIFMNKKDFLKKLELYLSESIFIAGILFFCVVMISFIYVKSNQIRDFSKYLPADETFAYAVFSIKDYTENSVKFEALQNIFNSYLGNDLSDLEFLGSDLAIAYVNEKPLFLLEIKSKKKTLEYMTSLKVENEELAQEDYSDSTMYSYPTSHPYKFTFLSDLLVFSNDIDAIKLSIDAAESGSHTVNKTANFQNLKSRLPYFSSAFFYVNLPKSRLHLVQIFAKMGIYEPGFLEPLLQLFPTFGATINIEDTGWYMETFTSVDKARLGGEALFKYETKYDTIFLSYSSRDFLFEWGGHNTKAQIFRIIDLLNNLHSSSALIFESAIQAVAEKYFGDGIILDTEIYPILDGEYFYGWTPDTDNSFTFLLELDSGESEIAYKLRDLFVRNFTYKKEVQKEVALPDGTLVTETQAEIQSLFQEEAKYNSQPYALWKVNDEILACIFILDNFVLIADDVETATKTLDIIKGTAQQRSLSYRQILAGSDEIFILNTNMLPEENILNRLFEGFKSVASTRKVFDDGIFTRHSLLFE